MLLATGLAGSAEAEVKSVAPSGFEIVETMTIHAPPEQVYAALGKIGQWWSSSHTFSRDASNLSLDLKAGGCLCERLKDGGSVQHLIVVYAAPGEGLRLRGALGPLQMEANVSGSQTAAVEITPAALSPDRCFSGIQVQHWSHHKEEPSHPSRSTRPARAHSRHSWTSGKPPQC